MEDHTEHVHVPFYAVEREIEGQRPFGTPRTVADHDRDRVERYTEKLRRGEPRQWSDHYPNRILPADEIQCPVYPESGRRGGSKDRSKRCWKGRGHTGAHETHETHRDPLDLGAPGAVTLNRVVEGADPTSPEPGTRMSPGQFWALLLRLDPEARLDRIRKWLDAADRGPGAHDW